MLRSVEMQCVLRCLGERPWRGRAAALCPAMLGLGAPSAPLHPELPLGLAVTPAAAVDGPGCQKGTVLQTAKFSTVA